MFNIPVSNGELIDKITILVIKQEKIKDNEKLKHINNELKYLTKFLDELKLKFDLESKIIELKTINLKLWNIEDDIRTKEKNKEFDSQFIELARSVYITNDERAKTKLEINTLTKSELIEVKSYEKYN